MARPAAAQATPSAEPAQPPSDASAVTVAPAAAPSPAIPAGFVRVYVRTPRNKGTARVYSGGADRGWQLLCQTPCVADVRPGTELRVTLGAKEDEPHTVVVTGEMGSEMDVEVRSASVGPLIGGIVMMAGGGGFVVSGLFFVAMADVADSVNRSSRSDDSLKTTGYVCIGLGAAAAIGGLVWLLTRSHEPRTLESPHHASVASGANVASSRTEMLRGDLASSKPRDGSDPTTLVPAPLTPLQLRFTF